MNVNQIKNKLTNIYNLSRVNKIRHGKFRKKSSKFNFSCRFISNAMVRSTAEINCH